MSKIKYEFADRTCCEVEVGEEFHFEHLLMAKKEALTNRKETRRHQSLEKLLEHGWNVHESKINVEDEIERKEVQENMHKAILKLSEKQQELVKQVFFQTMRIVDIAKEQGVNEATIRTKLKRIYTKLRTFLK